MPPSSIQYFRLFLAVFSHRRRKCLIYVGIYMVKLALVPVGDKKKTSKNERIGYIIDILNSGRKVKGDIFSFMASKLYY